MNNARLSARAAAFFTAAALSLAIVTGLAGYALPEQPAAAVQLAAATSTAVR